MIGILKSLKGIIAYSIKFINSGSKNIILKLAKSSIYIALAYMIFKSLPFNTKVRLIYKETEENKLLLNTMKNKEYKPTFYLPGFYFQHIFHKLYPPRPKLNFKREYIKTLDRALLSLDWALNDSCNEDESKLFVVFHGLTGGTEAGYLREMIRTFLKHGGYKIVVVHNRGINDTPLFTPYTFHAAYYLDFLHAMKVIQKRYPDKECYTLGISMGANIFSKLLAQESCLNNYIKAFISISNPFNLLIGEKRNRGSLVDYTMRKALILYVDKHNVLKSHKELESIKNMRDLDEKITIKIHTEFKSVEDYYTKASSCHDLEKIKIRSLFINALDDYISPVDTVDHSLFTNNEKLMLLLTPMGGHVCWWTGFFLPRRWCFDKALDFAESIHKLYN